MTGRTRVSIGRCEEYAEHDLDEHFLLLLKNIGFDPDCFKGTRVALKPNMLSATSPERAVVTHPAFFAAAVRMVKAHGGKPVLVESPAFQSIERVAARTGYSSIIEREKLEVWDNKSLTVIANNDGRKFKKFDVARPLDHADILLNLPKIKTHTLTGMTCSVKNLFGIIPGLAKSQWHMRARTREEFPEMLLDLYGAVSSMFSGNRLMLHLVDGILGMEGEGPGPAGTPRKLNIALAGTDAVAVDRVVARLTGLDSMNLATISSADSRGLGIGRLEDIEIGGERLNDMTIKDFAAPSLRLSSRLQYYALRVDFFRNLCIEKPVPEPEFCTLCYQCRNICPAGAIGRAVDGARIPTYDYSKCIRCYCCMEICPEAAIRLRKGKLQWIIDRL